MITGIVSSDREAVVVVQVRGSDGFEEPVNTILDTGFNGFLTLPTSLISRLGFSFAGTTRAMLGDGNEVQLDVFEATILWDGQERTVITLAAEGGALVGMSLLAGYRVTMDVEDEGSVLIEAL